MRAALTKTERKKEKATGNLKSEHSPSPLHSLSSPKLRVQTRRTGRLPARNTRPLPRADLFAEVLDLPCADVRVALDDALDLVPELVTAGGRVFVLEDEVAKVRGGDVGRRGEDGVGVVATFLVEGGWMG